MLTRVRACCHPKSPPSILAGTPTATPRAMTVAVPVWQERVSPVFDAASRLLIVRQQRGRELDRKEFVLGALSSEILARSVLELHVDVLLCAAISEPLRRALERGGVRVEPHLCGQVDALLHAFRAGNCRRAEFRMPGCWDRHDQQTRPRPAVASRGQPRRRTRSES
jgi:predicted Fe-Mo cluster-binding NifX family protein